MPVCEIVGCELRRDAAPAARNAGSEHRQRGRRACQEPHEVWQQRGETEADEDGGDRDVLGAVASRAGRRKQGRADHAEDDREHRDMLAAPGVLAEHPLGEQQKHEQAAGKRRLHDDERREQQRDDLQRPAEDRQSGAEEPARAADQSQRERHAQVLALRRLLRVHRLQRDP